MGNNNGSIKKTNENVLNMKIKDLNYLQTNLENEKQSFSQHYKEIIDKNKYDPDTRKCIYIVAYWTRTSYIQYNLSIISMDSISINIIAGYAEIIGVFGHTKKAQIKAQHLWYRKRLKYLTEKEKILTQFRQELCIFNNAKTIKNKKHNKIKYWKCNIHKTDLSLMSLVHKKNTKADHISYPKERKDDLYLVCTQKHDAVYKGKLIIQNLNKSDVFGKRWKLFQCLPCSLNSKKTNVEDIIVGVGKYHEYIESGRDGCQKCGHARYHHQVVYSCYPDEFNGSDLQF
eukprot:288653_1